MFNLFGKKEKKSEKVFSDISFMSQHAKEQAIQDLARKNSDPVFIAWFADTAAAFRKLFAENGLDESRIGEAKQFSSHKYGDKQIIFLEHFPVREKEEQLVQFCAQENFIVYNSMDEPFFKYFGSDKIIDLMKRLGMSENEPIEHKLISSSVENAQKKIANKVTVDQAAGSQEEWMKRNTNG